MYLKGDRPSDSDCIKLIAVIRGPLDYPGDHIRLVNRLSF
jgi:hypothetical protein